MYKVGHTIDHIIYEEIHDESLAHCALKGRSCMWSSSLPASTFTRFSLSLPCLSLLSTPASWNRSSSFGFRSPLTFFMSPRFIQNCPNAHCPRQRHVFAFAHIATDDAAHSPKTNNPKRCPPSSPPSPSILPFYQLKRAMVQSNNTTKTFTHK